MVLIFLLYLPWLPIFWRQAGGRPAIRTPLFQFLWDSIRWLSFGGTIPDAGVFWPTVAAIALLLWAWLVGRRQVLIPLLGTAVPLLFMYGAGTTLPAFYKFMLAAVPFFAVAAIRDRGHLRCFGATMGGDPLRHKYIETEECLAEGGKGGVGAERGV